jgi:hypothetical protein
MYFSRLRERGSYVNKKTNATRMATQMIVFICIFKLFFSYIVLGAGLLFFGSAGAGAGTGQLQTGQVAGFMDLYTRYPSISITNRTNIPITKGDLKRELLLLL